MYAGINELIDTCWDVNCSHISGHIHNISELIDTCWDVNLNMMEKYQESAQRINRYMLGCKWR